MVIEMRHEAPDSELLISCITTSRLSITQLILPVDFGFRPFTLRLLFDLRFPNLTYLHLGDWIRNWSWSSQGMTRFVIAHPLIEHLTIGFKRIYPDDETTTAEFSESFVTTDEFPHLHTFRGRASNFMLLAKQGVRSLRTLRTLGVCTPFYSHRHLGARDPLMDLDEMFETLKSFGGLPFLKEFYFASSHYPRERLEQWIAALAELCPALERLSGGIWDVQAVSHSTNALRFYI
jgi:hypothetical protein